MLVFVYLSQGAVGLSSVYDYGIFWSYSLNNLCNISCMHTQVMKVFKVQAEN